jgi:tetratricopeptide (TPR) repeat protein
MRSVCLIGLVLVLASASAGSALADNKEEAKAAFAKGREYYMSEKYDEALVELKRAYALQPHPALLRYMGDTYFKLNKARMAIKHYKLYLEAAPQAADKEKVLEKVNKLEMIVGASDEPESAPTPGPAAPAQPPQAASPATIPPPPETVTEPEVAPPTGEDQEDPIALAQREAVAAQLKQEASSRAPSQTYAIMKWSFLGVGAVALGLGIGFNRWAASEASKLEDEVKSACPENSPDCGGNPNMDDPVVAYQKEHHELQQAYKEKQTGAVVMLIGGGACLAASALFFYLDAGAERPRRAAATRGLSVAPVIGNGTFGVAAEVGF